MPMRAYVAFDLGAESGRAMLATLNGLDFTIEEVHRFANIPQQLPSGLHWNITELWRNLVEGLHLAGEAARRKKVEIASLGVDTWGVDFGLVGKSGQLLGLPFAYRDERNAPAMKHAIHKLGREKIYDATGVQFMTFNSVYQLLAQQAAEPGVLEHATHMLTIPDLLHFFFSGERIIDATNASTTQMIDPQTGKWATGLLHELGLPTHFLHETLPAGMPIGELREAVAKKANVPRIKVVNPCGHDTACAVAAVPVDKAATPSWAYISSGTWSLMGAELDEPIVNDAALAANFTNERGVDNKIRFLKNIAGLWLVQQVRADFATRGKEYDYATLAHLADRSEPFRTIIDPDYAAFAAPGDMCSKIAEFAAKTGQPAPATDDAGAFVRCCVESLAFAYRRTLDQLEGVLGKTIDVLHIVGGGGRNELLNQLTADAINRPVIVGPYEGTAVGNALCQGIAMGDVRDLAHLREIVRHTFSPKRFEPMDATGFQERLKRFDDVCH